MTIKYELSTILYVCVFDDSLPKNNGQAKFSRPGRSESSGNCDVDVFELQNAVTDLKSKVSDLDIKTDSRFQDQVNNLVKASSDSIKSAVATTADLVAPQTKRIDSLYEDLSSLKDDLTKQVNDATAEQKSKLDDALKNLEDGNKDALDKVDAKIKEATDASAKLKTDLEEANKKLETTLTASINKNKWANLYTRWGHTECPTGSAKWYDGVMYTAHQGHSGSGEMECLIRNNQNNGGQNTGTSSLDLIYPAAIDHNHGTDLPRNRIFGCARCISEAPCFETRGLDSCPDGYDMKYKGWLVGSHHGNPAPIERVCIDEKPNANYGSHNGVWMYVTRVQASSSNVRTGISMRCGMCCKK
jgi:hypothetical protein